MLNQDDLNRVEPGIPQGTNASLLSPSGMPIHSDSGTTDENARGLMGRVSSVVDSGKSRLAGGLHDLGDRIEHKGRDLQTRGTLVRPVARALNSTGEALEGSARYLRDNDLDVIGDDVVSSIRTHPLVSAGVALGCGFLLGKIMSDSDEDESEERFSHSHASHHDDHDDDESDEHEDEDEHSRSTFGDMVMGRMSSIVASGIASIAARRIRDRIAGR